MNTHHYTDEGIHGMNYGFTKYLISKFGGELPWSAISMESLVISC